MAFNIVSAFAAYGAGTPKNDDLTFSAAARVPETAGRPFLAKLPGQLLSKGAMAVVSLVDRNWTHSFQGQRGEPSIETSAGFLRQMLNGATVGLGMELYRQRTARDAGTVLELSRPAESGSAGQSPLQSLDALATKSLIAAKDMRNYIVLGDPAVSIRMQDEEAEPAGPKD